MDHSINKDLIRRKEPWQPGQTSQNPCSGTSCGLRKALKVESQSSGKYLYVMIGFPLLALFLTRKKYRSKDFGLFVLAAMALFFVLNPYLWNDPFNRLAGSLLFHLKYTQGTDI